MAKGKYLKTIIFKTIIFKELLLQVSQTNYILQSKAINFRKHNAYKIYIRWEVDTLFVFMILKIKRINRKTIRSSFLKSRWKNRCKLQVTALQLIWHRAKVPRIFQH